MSLDYLVRYTSLGVLSEIIYITKLQFPYQMIIIALLPPTSKYWSLYKLLLLQKTPNQSRLNLRGARGFLLRDIRQFQVFR